MFLAGSAWGQILTFENSALGGSEATTTSNSNDANLTTSTLSRGSGLTASGNSGRFNATNWALTSIDNAVSGNNYMEFTITPNSGYQFSITSILFQIQRSSTGLSGIALRSSMDSYSTNLDAEKSVTDNTSTQQFTFTFSQTSDVAVTYRLYGYSESTGGSAGIGDGTGDDIVVSGSVVSSTTSIVTIASTSQLTASSPEQNTDNVKLSFFDITVTDAAATLESLSVNTSGTYITGDIKTDGFKLWMDSDANFTGATQIGTSLSSASGNGETLTFSSLSTEIAVGTSYFWITTDIDVQATVSNTISLDAIANTDFTFTSADKSGSVTAGGTITFLAASVPIVAISETSLSDFGSVVNGSSSSEDSFTVSGDNLSSSVTVTAPTGFEVSTTSGSNFGASVSLTQTGGNLDGEPVTVYVRFAPVAAEGSTTGDITISSSTDEFSSETVSVSGNSLDTEPSIQASAASFSNATHNTSDISWTRGDGAFVIVLLKEGSAVDSDPVDATNYFANASFGSGTEIGTGNHVVYEGTGTSVSVTGLSSATTYHVAVYEFNEGSGTSQNYTTSPSTASQLTLTPSQPQLIISQYYEGASSDKYIEITNTGSSSADLTTVALALWSNNEGAPLGSATSVITLSGTLASGASKIYKNSGAANPTYANSNATSNSAMNFNGNDAIAILFDGSSWADRIDCIFSESSDTWGSDKSFVRNFNVINGTTTVSAFDGSGEWTQFSLSEVANAATDASEYLGFHSYGYEQEITGSAGYRMLSAPVTGFTVSDISDDTAIQGVPGGDNTGFTSNFYFFGSTGSWATPTDVNTSFGDGYGFIVKFFNNALNGSSELPITLDVSGSEPSSDVVVSLNKTINVSNEESTVYYTLVGNPFASNLDLSTLSVNNSGTLSQNVAVWDNANSQYDIVSTSTNILSPWQGFWAFVLQADDATELTIPVSGKTSSDTTATYFRKQAASPIEGIFTLSHNEKTSNPFKVLLHENAKIGFDVYDFSSITPLSEAYAVIGGRQLSNSSLKAIESLPMDLNEVVELAIEPQIVGNSGEFTINWKQFSQFPEAFTIELHDSQTGETYDLRNDGMVTFTLESASQKAKSKSDDLVLSGGSDRFKVVITPITTSVESGNAIPTSVELSQNFPNPFNPSTTIQYAVPAQSNVRLAVYDMLGREVAVLVNGTKAAGNYEFTFDASALSSGMYIYRLEAAGTVMTRKMTLIK